MAHELVQSLANEVEYILNSVTFGLEVETLRKPYRDGSYLYDKANNLGWHTHRDVSVDPQNHAGYEAVSPILTITDYRDRHREFIDDMLDNIVPTMTAGTHVHVGVNNISGQSKVRMKLVKNIADFWIKHDRFISNTVANRRKERAHWVKLMQYKGYGRQLKQLIDSCSDTYELGCRVGHENRYHTLNMYSLQEHGTVEFRVWNSSDRMSYVENGITFSFAVVAYCMLKTMFPQSFKDDDFMQFEKFMAVHDEVKKFFHPEYSSIVRLHA